MNIPDNSRCNETTFYAALFLSLSKTINNLIFSGLLLFGLTSTVNAQHNEPNIRVAIGDIPGLDMLIIESAAARTRERGVLVTISYMQSEDMATQAIINGLADVGMGTPYSLIQNTNAPLKMFYQLNTLRFFPVVDKRHYTNWQDLDGAPMYTHGKGSGTEAIMRLMAREHDISYSAMNYVPGSGVRADAMIKGRIHATIVDTERRNRLLNHPSAAFITLPIPEIYASDEALYSHSNFLKEHREQIVILVEELIQVSRLVNADPENLIKLRDQYGLLKQSTQGKEAAIKQMYSELVSVNAIPNNGGSEAAAQADMTFYSASGALKGSADTLRAENFWDFTPVREALTTLNKH